METEFRRVEADIDLDAIQKNIETIQKLNDPAKKTLLVVKADAYGHGAVTVAREMESLADYFGVACIEEALELRRGGIQKPILILGYTDETEFPDLIREDITAAVYQTEQCRKLSDLAGKMGKKARVHIKADSGMSRIGYQCDEEGVREALPLKDLPGLSVEGIFTHYARADERDKTAARSQYEAFTWYVHRLEEERFHFRYRHIDNSAGAMELHSAGFDMMRLGIVIYGLYPSEEVTHDVVLYPAMSLRSRIVHLKVLPKGRGISYGWIRVTDKPTRVATISCGYADGYPRAQSDKGYVLIHGKKAPILGRVCMDQMMVDVTDIPEASLRDPVTLIGTDQNQTISVESVAEPANSFNYEQVCRIARRVPRVYFRNGQKISEVRYV